MFNLIVKKISLACQTIKMNKIYLFLVLTFTSYTFSQEYTAEQRANFAKMVFNVSGIVTDSETSEPLEYATISLEHKRIPEKIFGGVTDENGKFSVDVNPGLYDLKIAVSYTHLTLPTKA